MKEDYKGYTIEISYDECAESPREWDNLGTILSTHRRYTLGDKDATWGEIKDMAKRKDIIYLPVFCYEHGNIALSTSPYSCPWDSGQCGIIYVKKDTVRKEYRKKRISKKLSQKVENVLSNEIKTFSLYVSGEAYGYKITSPEGEELDSCYGFFGVENCIQEARSMIDYYTKEERS